MQHSLVTTVQHAMIRLYELRKETKKRNRFLKNERRDELERDGMTFMNPGIPTVFST
jgi:hypothetical protein